MSDAPERIYMDPDIKFPECEKQYGCDVEYIRADHVEALLKAEREKALREAARHAASATGDLELFNSILALIENPGS